jgi:hypothetical protein
VAKPKDAGTRPAALLLQGSRSMVCPRLLRQTARVNPRTDKAAVDASLPGSMTITSANGWLSTMRGGCHKLDRCAPFCAHPRSKPVADGGSRAGEQIARTGAENQHESKPSHNVLIVLGRSLNQRVAGSSPARLTKIPRKPRFSKVRTSQADVRFTSGLRFAERDSTKLTGNQGGVGYHVRKTDRRSVRRVCGAGRWS